MGVDGSGRDAGNSHRREAATVIEQTCPRHQQVATLARDLADLLDDQKASQQLSTGN